MILLENLVEMGPVGGMTLFDVAHKLVLLFILASAVMNMALKWVVNLMI